MLEPGMSIDAGVLIAERVSGWVSGKSCSLDLCLVICLFFWQTANCYYLQKGEPNSLTKFINFQKQKYLTLVGKI